MRKHSVKTIARALAFAAQIVITGTLCVAGAQSDRNPYPAMAPLDQYLMPDRDAEVELARSAAPKSRLGRS